MKTDYTIEFKGKKYQLDKEYFKGEMVNNSVDFQYEQLMYCLKTQDFDTLKNRITNMTLNGGLIEIK